MANAPGTRRLGRTGNINSVMPRPSNVLGLPSFDVYQTMQALTTTFRADHAGRVFAVSLDHGHLSWLHPNGIVPALGRAARSSFRGGGPTRITKRRRVIRPASAFSATSARLSSKRDTYSRAA